LIERVLRYWRLPSRWFGMGWSSLCFPAAFPLLSPATLYDRAASTFDIFNLQSRIFTSACTSTHCRATRYGILKKLLFWFAAAALKINPLLVAHNFRQWWTPKPLIQAGPFNSMYEPLVLNRRAFNLAGWYQVYRWLEYRPSLTRLSVW